MNETFEKYLEEDRKDLEEMEKKYGPLSEADRAFFLKCASQSRRPSTPEEKKRAQEAWEYLQEYRRKSAAQEEAEKKDKR